MPKKTIVAIGEFMLILLLITLSTFTLISCSGTNSCAEITTESSWADGMRLKLNHCAVVEVLSDSAAAASITALVTDICPNIICKGAAAAIAAFIVSQAVSLQDADDQCGKQGAIIEIASFNHKTLWKIKPVCTKTMTTNSPTVLATTSGTNTPVATVVPTKVSQVTITTNGELIGISDGTSVFDMRESNRQYKL